MIVIFQDGTVINTDKTLNFQQVVAGSTPEIGDGTVNYTCLSLAQFFVLRSAILAALAVGQQVFDASTPIPVVSSVSPSSVPHLTNATVIITGSNFNPKVKVVADYNGSHDYTGPQYPCQVEYVNATTIKVKYAMIPDTLVAYAGVTVVNPNGTAIVFQEGNT